MGEDNREKAHLGMVTSKISSHFQSFPVIFLLLGNKIKKKKKGRVQEMTGMTGMTGNASATLLSPLLRSSDRRQSARHQRGQ
jgi:hypothetical protein